LSWEEKWWEAFSDGVKKLLVRMNCRHAAGFHAAPKMWVSVRLRRMLTVSPPDAAFCFGRSSEPWDSCRYHAGENTNGCNDSDPRLRRLARNVGRLIKRDEVLDTLQSPLRGAIEDEYLIRKVRGCLCLVQRLIVA